MFCFLLSNGRAQLKTLSLLHPWRSVGIQSIEKFRNTTHGQAWEYNPRSSKDALPYSTRDLHPDNPMPISMPTRCPRPARRSRGSRACITVPYGSNPQEYQTRGCSVFCLALEAFSLKNTACLQPPRVQLSCLLYTSPSPRDRQKSRMPSSA